jgi:hypothetical protein
MPKRGLAEPHRLFKDCLEDGREVARRGVDDLQDLGRRGLLVQRLIAFGSALGKLTLQIGYPLLRIA